MRNITRRQLLGGGIAVGGGLLLSACTNTQASTPNTPAPTTPTSLAFPPSSAEPAPGQAVIEKTLRAAATELDLDGQLIKTWAYGDTVPGVELRAKAGDFMRLTLDNQLPADSSIHWHGIALPNGADGVPGMTQEPVRPGEKFSYGFTVPDPGTYFYHPHVGVQLDRGLYAPLIVEDPAEPGGYDNEWVLVLDDWVDGTGRTPDDVLAELAANNSGNTGGGMGGMNHGTMSNGPFGEAGDVTYPHYLINGSTPASPATLDVKPGQRIRLRIINAASDTIFAVAVGGQTMTITHTDGFPVEPQQADALYIGMGERFDATVTVGDGAFPVVAKPWGKQGQAMAVIRTSGASAPPPDVQLAEFGRPTLQASDLGPTEPARLPDKKPDAQARILFGGQMNPYVWTINGTVFGQDTPLEVSTGQRLSIDVRNGSMMTHPLHIHGHTFALPNGLRKDTVLLAPMQRTTLQLEADNPGIWAVHCHNIYHAEAGMTTSLRYR